MFVANACLCFFFIQKGDKLGGNPGKLCEIARTPPPRTMVQGVHEQTCFYFPFSSIFFSEGASGTGGECQFIFVYPISSEIDPPE